MIIDASPGLELLNSGEADSLTISMWLKIMKFSGPVIALKSTGPRLAIILTAQWNLK